MSVCKERHAVKPQHQTSALLTCPVSCSENEVEDEEDLYDCVYDDEEGGEIYEDLMKTEAIPPPVSPPLTSLSTV